MKQSISRRQFLKASGLAAAGACAAGLLSSCGGKSGGSSSGSASGADTSKYTVLYSSQPATLNYLTTATDLEMVVGANCVDTLVEYDNKGVMREGLATKWEWDADTLTWTFTLREENWVDNNGEVVAPVTAQDFVDALQYVLTPDYASSNVGLVTAYIAGRKGRVSVLFCKKSPPCRGFSARRRFIIFWRFPVFYEDERQSMAACCHSAPDRRVCLHGILWCGSQVR